MPQTGKQGLFFYIFWVNQKGEPMSVTQIDNTTLEIPVDALMVAHAKPVGTQIEITNTRLEGVLFDGDTTTCWKLYRAGLLGSMIKKVWAKLNQGESTSV